ncbi:MAG: hypothetical protein JXD21_05875 [Candidatus Omnitrophica bacterium]|nr:hypothetical protein [Candidatus Omnitrophota bacterium]
MIKKKVHLKKEWGVLKNILQSPQELKKKIDTLDKKLMKFDKKVKNKWSQ